MVLKGIKVRLGSEVHQMIALTPSQLVQMYLYVSLLDSFQVSCWTAIIFSFRTLLRKLNFLPETSSYKPHLISSDDVEFFPGAMIVYVKTSKTDRSGGKPQKIVVYETTQQPLCTVSWLREHIQSTPKMYKGLFAKHIKGEFAPLTYRDVLQYLKKLVADIGLNPKDAGLHSLRCSGASYMNSIGISLPDIKLIGYWRSSAVFDYIKRSE